MAVELAVYLHNTVLNYLVIGGTVLSLIGLVVALVLKQYRMAGICLIGVFIIQIASPNGYITKSSGLSMVSLISNSVNRVPLWLVLIVLTISLMVAFAQLMGSAVKKG